MKKLTKDQRYTAYCIMLAMFEASDQLFLYNAAKAIGLIPENTDCYLKGVLPELWAKKPKEPRFSFAWFAAGSVSTGKRIAILKQCIEETQDF